MLSERGEREGGGHERGERRERGERQIERGERGREFSRESMSITMM